MEQKNDFRLFAYLASDLNRAQVLLGGGRHNLSGIKFWLGIFSPRFIPVLLCRLAYYFYLVKLSPIAKCIALLNFFLFGIEISIRCPIGKGLFFPHTQGTVIGAWAIGENAIIFQGVTLGALKLDFSYNQQLRPIVGDNVTIGSGAKILGNVSLGSESTIGANAVVLIDVPRGSLAVGIPAEVLRTPISALL